MKYTPTLYKTIVSILAFIITDYYISSAMICRVASGVKCSQSMLDPINIALSLIPLIAVYLIWSFFQKKYRSKTRCTTPP